MPTADINKQTHPHIHANPHKTVSWAMKLHALSITRWKHADASIKEPVHLSFAVDLSQLSFFQRGTVKEVPASQNNTRPLPNAVWPGVLPPRGCYWSPSGTPEIAPTFWGKTPTCGGLSRVH